MHFPDETLEARALAHFQRMKDEVSTQLLFFAKIYAFYNLPFFLSASLFEVKR